MSDSQTSTPYIKAIEYICLFIFMIYAGSATVFARGINDIRTIGNAVAIIASLVLIYTDKVSFGQAYYRILIVLGVYFLFSSTLNGFLNLYFLSTRFLAITYGYVLVKAFQKRFFFAYENTMYFLCLCSLVFWLLEIVLGEGFNVLFSRFSFSESYTDDHCNVLYNLLIYSKGSNIFADSNIGFTNIPRNPGFCWEPGAFSVYITFAIACNFISSNFSIRNNKRLIVFFITLLTTQSTTGMSIIVVMLLAFSLLATGKRRYWSILLIPLAVYLFSLPFLSDKLFTQIALIDPQQKLAEFDRYGMSWTALDRFNSFILQWEEFMRHPILGLGVNTEGSWLKLHGYENVSLISGYGSLLSGYGLLICFAYFSVLIRGINNINHLFQSKNAYNILIVFICLLISYSIYLNPIVVAFWLYGYTITEFDNA